MKFLAIAALAATACAGTYQSAKPLAPGKTQIAIAASRVSDDRDSKPDYMGDVMVRYGLVDGLDGGLHLGLGPANLNGGDLPITVLAQLAVDAKARIYRSGGVTISFDLPAGVSWEQSGFTFHGRLFGIAPAVLFGLELNSTTELVFTPESAIIREHFTYDPDITHVGGGFSIGLRFSDSALATALQPQVGFIAMKDGPTLYTVGIAVAAGN